MKVVSAIGEILNVNRPAPSRKFRDVNTLVVHRYSIAHVPGYKDDAASAAKFFRHHPDGLKATNGLFAYHFLLHEDGLAEQCLPLLKKGAAAIGLNTKGIQIACVGDFRKKPMPKAQLEALTDLCAILSGIATNIVGHTEVHGASHDPNKDCPGKALDLNALRASVATRRLTVGTNLDPRDYGIIW
jgi:N-acetyl-anhydromuramyl-L-alanine amidase AmpD